MELKRSSEISCNFRAFNKDDYLKEELFNEYILFQNELVGMTFESEHAKRGNLRVWDVYKHFEQLNKHYNGVYDDKLKNFKENCKKLNDLIRIEISGMKAEAKVFLSLEKVDNPCSVLTNVELYDGVFHTEIDAIVIVPGTIVIVEVKNSNVDTMINENGDFYNAYGRKQTNIVEKLARKELVLKNIIRKENLHKYKIKTIVVFTNSRSEVLNRYNDIETCFSFQLSSILNGIDRIDTEDEELLAIEKVIIEHECKQKYPVPFDVEEFKYEFADIMSFFEIISAPESKDMFEHEESQNIKENYCLDFINDKRREITSVIISGIVASSFVIKLFRRKI